MYYELSVIEYISTEQQLQDLMRVSISVETVMRNVSVGAFPGARDNTGRIDNRRDEGKVSLFECR